MTKWQACWIESTAGSICGSIEPMEIAIDTCRNFCQDREGTDIQIRIEQPDILPYTDQDEDAEHEIGSSAFTTQSP